MQASNFCIMLVLICLCCQASAQNPNTKSDIERKQAEAFLSVYFNYMDVINTQSVVGLKTITTSNFILKWWDQEALTGEKAFVELKKHLVDPATSDQRITAIKLRRLVIVGDQAFVQTEEAHSLQSKNGSARKITMTWNMYFKQTWRKTAQGWRLAVWEKGAKNLFGSVSAATYTISWQPTETEILPLHPKAPGSQ